MRVVERFLSLLLALAVIAGSALLALEVGWAAVGRSPLLIDWRTAYASGNRNAWDTTPIRNLAIVLVAVGLLLLIAELKPRRAPRLELASTDPYTDAAITRRSLRATLLNGARQVDGISDAKAKVSKRKINVRAVSRLGTADTAKGLTGDLESALRDRLDALQLATTPTLRARVAARRGARSA
jgi:hypothetical protein